MTNDTPTSTDEVKPTPVGKFNYRPGVSVRSANQPQTELGKKLREKLDRLIIENQSEDGSIDISDQRAMRDEIMQLILAHQEKAVREARIDEWDYIHETMHAANQTATEYATETMKDRIAELTSKNTEAGDDRRTIKKGSI